MYFHIKWQFKLIKLINKNYLQSVKNKNILEIFFYFSLCLIKITEIIKIKGYYFYLKKSNHQKKRIMLKIF